MITIIEQIENFTRNQIKIPFCWFLRGFDNVYLGATLNSLNDYEILLSQTERIIKIVQLITLTKNCNFDSEHTLYNFLFINQFES